MLTIFIFSLTVSTVNDLGIFDMNMEGVGLEANESQMEDIQVITDQEVLSGDDYIGSNPDLGGTEMFVKMFRIFVNALGMVVYIHPTLVSIGFPIAIATMIQTIITLVEAIGLIGFYRKYRVG